MISRSCFLNRVISQCYNHMTNIGMGEPSVVQDLLNGNTN